MSSEGRRKQRPPADVLAQHRRSSCFPVDTARVGTCMFSFTTAIPQGGVFGYTDGSSSACFLAECVQPAASASYARSKVGSLSCSDARSKDCSLSCSDARSKVCSLSRFDARSKVCSLLCSVARVPLLHVSFLGFGALACNHFLELGPRDLVFLA